MAVAGGTGLNGSYTVKEPTDAGARVRAITHKRPSNEFNCSNQFNPTVLTGILTAYRY